MNNIEDIAEFLGENIISERLLPYILSFPNLKDDLLTVSTLKGLRVLSHHVVGVDELKYIITSCDNLFYDLNEIIVLESIKTVHYIAMHHYHVFESDKISISTISKLILFCLHPNNQIKEYSIKTICQVVKHKSASFLYVNVLPTIKRFIKTPLIMKLKEEKELTEFLHPQVSRFSFDLAINKFYFTSNEPFRLSIQDKSTLCLIQELLNAIPKQTPHKPFSESRGKGGSNRSYLIRKVMDNENYDEQYEDLSQFIEWYYYPMESVDLDIKHNENNFGLNKTQRHPKKSAYDVYYQELYNSVKGLLVVDPGYLSGSSHSGMIKRSADLGTPEEEGVIGDWHPRGRLINTIYPVN